MSDYQYGKRCIRCIFQIMTKTCNFLQDLTESITFKLEVVHYPIDLHLPKIGPNYLTAHNSIDKNQFFQTRTYYRLLDSECNAGETLQKNRWIKIHPKSVILK